MSDCIRGRNIARTDRFAVASACLALALAAAWLAPAGMAADSSASPTRPTATAPAQASEQAQTSGQGPKFRCDEPVHKYGMVWAMEKVEHEFVVHNDGDSELTVEARPTCSCTVAEYDKAIPPGGTGKIKTVLTASNSTGPYNRTINVITNDPEKRTVHLTLSGDVKQRVSSEPYLMAHFGQYSPGIPLSKTFKLTNNTDKPMKLELVPPQEPTCYNVELKEIEAGKTAELTVTAEPPFKDDANNARFFIKTGLEDAPDLPLPCSIIKPPAIQILPPAIRFSSSVDSIQRQSITVRNNSDEPIKLLSVESGDSRLDITHSETTPGKVWTIQVQIPVGYRPEAGSNAALTITTNYASKPTYTVPVVNLPHTGAPPARPPTTPPTTPPTPPPVAAVSADNLVGRSAPAVTVTTSDGRQVRLGSGSNQVMLVNFWASWCTASLEQTPMLEQLYQTYRRKGVEFLNISIDRYRPEPEVSELVRALDAKIPLVLDADQKVVKAFGVSDFPTMFLIGKDGNVEDVRRGIGRNQGELDTLEQMLTERLDLLLEGKTRVDFSARQISFGNLCRVSPPQPPGPTSNGPVFAVEALRQDAGAFKPGTKGEYKLYFRNNGNQPLEIRSVSGSNGLSVGADYPKSLAPGATGSALCSFETPAQPQRFIRQVAFDTNSVLPTPPVTIAAVSKPYIEVQPRKGVEFLSAARTFSVPRLATLLYNGSDKVEYKQAKSSSERFEVEIKETRQPHVALLIVRALPPFEPGDHQAIISIETNQVEQPVVTVPVNLHMPERIEVVPPEIELSLSRGMRQVQVDIVNSSETPLNILGVERSKPEIQTQFFPAPDGFSYKLQINVPPNIALDPKGESVTVRTDDEEYPKIVIPIKAEANPRKRVRGAGSIVP